MSSAQGRAHLRCGRLDDGLVVARCPGRMAPPVQKLGPARAKRTLGECLVPRRKGAGMSGQQKSGRRTGSAGIHCQGAWEGQAGIRGRIRSRRLGQACKAGASRVLRGRRAACSQARRPPPSRLLRPGSGSAPCSTRTMPSPWVRCARRRACRDGHPCRARSGPARAPSCRPLRPRCGPAQARGGGIRPPASGQAPALQSS